MWLIVGLGNPERSYENTRHNIGFMVIDTLSAVYSAPLKQRTDNFVFAKGFIEDQEVILLKPLTFMNRSGIAVRDVFKRYKYIDNMVVIHDDIDLDVGDIRIRSKGASGGHRGVESIIEAVGTREFIRIKLGIGRSERISPEKYVLREFNKRQRPVVDEAIGKAAEAIPVIIKKGVSAAQNIFHCQ
jgi:PTH1 family peptidyl-tRNA hydrolase